MTIKLIPAAEINNGTRIHCSVREAAKLLGVSESALRRAARAAGVTKIAGSTVSGGILIERHPNPIVVTYAA